MCPKRCQPASDSDSVLRAHCREKQRVGRWCCFLFFFEYRALAVNAPAIAGEAAIAARPRSKSPGHLAAGTMINSL